MKLGTLAAFLVCVLLPLTSCVVVPIPTDENKVLAGKPVTEEQLAFLTSKRTIKEEVIERLGRPNVIWEEARVFVYYWDMRQGILFWVVGGFPMAYAGMMDIPKHYLLLIQFDDLDRIQRFERAVVPASNTYAEFLQEWVKQSGAQ